MNTAIHPALRQTCVSCCFFFDFQQVKKYFENIFEKVCKIKKGLYICIVKQLKQSKMLHTKEFYEIMEVFEKNAKQLVSLGAMGLTKEPKENWAKQQYYCDGNANNAFKMFLHGVSLGKIL